MNLDFLIRGLMLEFMSAKIAAGAAAMVYILMMANGNTYLWELFAGLSFVITFSLVLSVSLACRLDIAPPRHSSEAIRTMAPVIQPRRIVNLAHVDQRQYWQQLAPVRLYGDWSSLADNDDTVRKVLAILDETCIASTRSMKGVLNARQLNHLKSFLHGRGWSTTWKASATRAGAEVLTDAGKAEVALYLPHLKR